MPEARSARREAYLGDVRVAPRSALSRLLEFDFSGGAYDAELEARVRSVVPLPLAREQDYLPAGSVVLDIAVLDYARGVGGHPLHGDFFLFSLARRPGIELLARLSDAASQDIIRSERVVSRVSFGRYLRRSLNPLRLLGFRRSDAKLFERLLIEGLLEVVDRMRRLV